MFLFIKQVTFFSFKIAFIFSLKFKYTASSMLHLNTDSSLIDNLDVLRGSKGFLFYYIWNSEISEKRSSLSRFELTSFNFRWYLPRLVFLWWMILNLVKKLKLFEISLKVKLSSFNK